MLGYHPERAASNAFAWRHLAAQIVYRGFWMTGVLVASVLATFILDRDGAEYVWKFINKWFGTSYGPDSGLWLITWGARLGGYALTVAVIYGSWLRFKRWGDKFRNMILGEKPNTETDEIV